MKRGVPPPAPRHSSSLITPATCFVPAPCQGLAPGNTQTTCFFYLKRGYIFLPVANKIYMQRRMQLCPDSSMSISSRDATPSWGPQSAGGSGTSPALAPCSGTPALPLGTCGLAAGPPCTRVFLSLK